MILVISLVVVAVASNFSSELQHNAGATIKQSGDKYD